MPNILPIKEQVLVSHMLAEGVGIRPIERITGVRRDTIVRLGVSVGEKCGELLDQSMRQLSCKHLQIDEIWAFVGKKQRNVKPEEAGTAVGDAWTYVALDPETKLVPSYVVGPRDAENTAKFTSDLSSRLKNRVQITTDGMNQYLATIDDAFGDEVDYGQIVKVYSNHYVNGDGFRRYSPSPFVSEIQKKVMTGNPEWSKISTSHVERQNKTMRMHIRRLTRLTDGFSKKLENLQAAVSLWFGYYNFVKIHSSIRCTPAMAAGVTSRIWSMEELVTWNPP